MVLKYQSLIDSFNLAFNCPDSSLVEIEVLAYRWAHTPITHHLNFLPNIRYDEEQGIPPRLLSESEICSRCGASFFTTEDKARERFVTYKKYLENKHKPFVNKYTHLAIGQIRKKDGKATATKNQHFGFYEYENCDFKKSFTLLEKPL